MLLTLTFLRRWVTIVVSIPVILVFARQPAFAGALAALAGTLDWFAQRTSHQPFPYRPRTFFWFGLATLVLGALLLRNGSELPSSLAHYVALHGILCVFAISKLFYAAPASEQSLRDRQADIFVITDATLPTVLLPQAAHRGAIGLLHVLSCFVGSTLHALVLATIMTNPDATRFMALLGETIYLIAAAALIRLPEHYRAATSAR